MNKRIGLFFAFSILAATQAYAGDSPAPCAVIERFGKATQIIPKSGPVATRFSEAEAISCGSMIITHGDGFWIRYSNQVTVKIAPNTFYEVGMKLSDTHRIYRGDALVSGPTGSGKMIFGTPNGEIHFEGGVFTVKYQTQTRTTSVASFNQSVDFKNKFNTQAFQKVSVGEISRLTIHDIRVVPTQPTAMSPSSVKEAIQSFGLAQAEQDEMIAIVARVFENRAKSLVSELEDFKSIPEAKEEDRSPASLTRYKPSVDEKEEEMTMKIMRRRLYGDDADLENSSARKPASVGAGKTEKPMKIDDSEKKNIEVKKHKETNRVMKEISNLNTEE